MPRVGFEQKPLADGSLSVESFRIDDSVEELTPLVNRAQAGQAGSIWLPGRLQDMAAGMPTHFWVTFTWPKMRLEAFVQAYLAGPTERAAFLGTPVQTVKNRLHAGAACHRVPRRSRPGPPRPDFL